MHDLPSIGKPRRRTSAARSFDGLAYAARKYEDGFSRTNGAAIVRAIQRSEAERRKKDAQRSDGTSRSRSARPLGLVAGQRSHRSAALARRIYEKHSRLDG